jgi:hypothetical protein
MHIHISSLPISFFVFVFFPFQNKSSLIIFVTLKKEVPFLSFPFYPLVFHQGSMPLVCSYMILYKAHYRKLASLIPPKIYKFSTASNGLLSKHCNQVFR